MERQILHVDVNNASPNGVTQPLADETGSIRSNAPNMINPPNPIVITRNDDKCFLILLSNIKNSPFLT